ncbi:LOW QUALITY PROTEIN: hypothetical protein U9M48_031225 [Paspalum notatum var. saurae]|uniref:Uncharacterized protein n=1 Tax=Paspalum notatum var. saurae TaxID=547442 RepID=A0AAQ3U2M6_PASNO
MRCVAWWAALLLVATALVGARGDRVLPALALAPEPLPDDRFALVPVEFGGVAGDVEGAVGLRGELPCQSHSSNSKTCEELNGSGSFNTTCVISSSSSLDGDLCVYGEGNMEIRPHVKIICPFRGCYLTFNVSGSIKIGEHVEVIAGSVSLDAANVSLDQHSTINTTALAGEPPPQTSGTPHSLEGAGGGHGGRGASCKVSNDTNWGGDVYAWSTLAWPWSYGSMGGSMSADHQYGGYGGGRIMLRANDSLSVDGQVLAEGGVGSLKGGGGSGGSIIIHAFKLYGNGTISAAGGNGWGGGGGGRISLDCYSIQQDLEITVHGAIAPDHCTSSVPPGRLHRSLSMLLLPPLPPCGTVVFVILLLRRTIDALQREFAMKDLGELHHFLGMEALTWRTSSVSASQHQYMLDILERAGMSECKPCSTPVDTNPKFSAVSGAPVEDASAFCSLAGALQYLLTFTRPDISYSVQQICLHMHDPRVPHLAALKRILRYVRGTRHLGLHLRPSSQCDLVA